MSGKHYSDDELVARLFGLGPADAHLDSCELCSRRWNQIRDRDQFRRRAEIEVPAELLTAQRRAIYARVERNPRKWRLNRLPLPVAAVLLLLLAFVLFRPTPQEQPADVISEDQALQDVFTVASRIDPAGLKPVQSLFEVQK
jgi:anti-sigma factor RsiW